jgi:hypothetical protein
MHQPGIGIYCTHSSVHLYKLTQHRHPAPSPSQHLASPISGRGVGDGSCARPVPLPLTVTGAAASGPALSCEIGIEIMPHALGPPAHAVSRVTLTSPNQVSDAKLWHAAMIVLLRAIQKDQKLLLCRSLIMK